MAYGFYGPYKSKVMGGNSRGFFPNLTSSIAGFPAPGCCIPRPEPDIMVVGYNLQFLKRLPTNVL
jgi:hypothetical protein